MANRVCRREQTPVCVRWFDARRQVRTRSGRQASTRAGLVRGSGDTKSFRLTETSMAINDFKMAHKAPCVTNAYINAASLMVPDAALLRSAEGMDGLHRVSAVL